MEARMVTESNAAHVGGFVWRSPKSYLLWQSQQRLNEGRRSFVRTMLIVALFMGAMYVLVKPLPWDEAGIRVNKLFLITSAVGFGISVLAYFVNPYFMRFSRAQYAVNAKGVSISGRLYSWRRICSCEPLKMNEPIEGMLSLQFKAKSSGSSVPLVFDAANQETAETVYQYIEAHIPEKNRLVQKPRLTLTMPQHYFIAGLSIVTGIVLSVTVMQYCFGRSEAAAVLFLFLLAYAGPGTWGVLAFYGRRIFRYRKWFGLMAAYNALAFFVLVLAGIFFIIIRLRSLL
jgi:hypothetical protein